MAEIQERLQAQLADRYLFERELGKGGMATVYLARDVKHDREVAIKVLDPDLAATIGGDRFEREIKLAAKLQHPHILGLFDSGAVDGLLFYVMPFVKGESLRDRLDREGQLPIDDAIQITLEVADALGHAHAQDIIHRDIKPENIMLTGGHALVADFGIARAVTEGTSQKLTQTGMAVGTPVYMAPEQSSGEAVGPTADLYALGAMLYEMLAGEPPFTAKSAMALMARHAMESVPSIRIVRPTVPEEVEDAIYAAMAKVPADRPQTAANFAEMLGLQMGTTTARRAAIRMTATRRVPTGANAQYGQQPVAWYRKPVVIGALAVAVIGAGLAVWRFGFAGTPAPAAGLSGLDRHNVAVLYFDDLSRDKQLGFLAEGMTDGLIKALAQVQGLKVVSKGGSSEWRGSTVAADSIARALQVGTLVRGSIEQEGDKLRVNVRLVDGNSGADFGERATIEQPASEVLQVQDAVAAQVAELIRRRLGEEIKLQQLRSGTRNAQAWSLVQQAEQSRKRGEVAAAQRDTLNFAREFQVADSLLALAETADAKWPEPVIQRGFLAYRRSRLAGLDRNVIEQAITVGMGHMGRALALDPSDPDALEIRGNLQYWSYLMGLQPDPAKANELLLAAQKDLEEATRISPTQAGAYASLSHLYYRTGTAVDVYTAAREAYQTDAFLDNAGQILNRLFTSSYDLEQFKDAEYWCGETRRRFPASPDGPRCELWLLTTKRDTAANISRAWAFADSMAALTPGARQEVTRLRAYMMTAAVIARAGLADSARNVVERHKGNAEVDPTRDVSLLGAFAYTQIGDKVKAVEMLKLYFAANERLRSGFANDPGWQFRSLVDDPGFRQAVGPRQR